jgi:hypothetical protein
MSVHTLQNAKTKRKHSHCPTDVSICLHRSAQMEFKYNPNFTETKILVCADLSISPHALGYVCADNPSVYGPLKREETAGHVAHMSWLVGSLFYDAFSVARLISVDEMVVKWLMMNWKGSGRKRSWPNFKVLSRNSPGGIEENHENPQSG